MYYSYVFCVLTYRTSSDLMDFIKSVEAKVKSYKIVIVNSFYDESSEKEIKYIAEKNNCDFYSVQNKGYSYGNNYGITKIIDKYEFNYIVVANPDIIIEKFNDESIKDLKGVVVAPIIKTKNNKNQNPYWMIKNPIAEKLLYYGQKKRSRLLYLCGVVMNKIIRELGIWGFSKSKKDNIKIYAAHGSCVLFQKEIFDKIGLFYDENMFLMAEEAYVSHVFEESNIPTLLTKNIFIRHKEDGSMDLSKLNANEALRNSYIYYYEKLKKMK